MEIRPVGTGAELRRAFDAAGTAIDPPLDSSDRRFTDLSEALREGRSIGALLSIDGSGTAIAGAVLGFLDGDQATLRIAGLAEGVRGRGAGRDLVRSFETQARAAGARRISLGTDQAVGFWFRLGYAVSLLGQWVDDPAAATAEIAAVIAGPGRNLGSRRTSFAGVPQLVTEVGRPSARLLDQFRATAPHADYGYLATKVLTG